MAGPPGYAFQPEWNDDELREVEEEAEDDPANDAAEPEAEPDRQGNTDWCRCGNCAVMPTAVECICCRELNQCCNLQEEGCVIDSEDFQSVCMTRVVLRVFHVARRDIRGHGARGRVRGRAPDEELENKPYRYASYRLFTYLVHGYLGKGVRKVIPSCVVMRIHREFPEPSDVYVGFRRGDDNEEVEVPEHLAI